jgi:hypothetical protein
MRATAALMLLYAGLGTFIVATIEDRFMPPRSSPLELALVVALWPILVPIALVLFFCSRPPK